MPLVHIELIEGRSQEQLKNLVKDVTKAVVENTGAPNDITPLTNKEDGLAHYLEEYLKLA